MKNIKNYNLYIFISTFTRNIIDIYSVIYLYKKGISVNSIIAIYSLIYFLGIFISTLSIKIGNLIGYKYILIFSSIITSISFYTINNSTNLYLIALSLSLSMFTYHPIKHYYGIKLLDHKKEIGKTLIFTYVAQLLSSYIAIKNIKLIYLVIISIIGLLPALLVKKDKRNKIIYPKKLPQKKLNFFIFDQFKIIFLLLEPLYLYLISNDLSYVGIFNIILTLSSIICIYILTNKINVNKNYKYINILFTIVLLFKLNIKSQTLLLVLAFFEGIGIKTNELVSTINLYDGNILNEGYIIVSEKIFCATRAFLLSIIFLLSLNLKTALYLLIIGIFILSFQLKKDTT